ncbi:hypothetical protein AAF712_009106 [Marasmius tenuissimus]|uniref:Peroxidase n=1 Tax=Marasmius tenuissimus TaxID=585030 RepID=A0ABR2ZS54_9AGAR
MPLLPLVPWVAILLCFSRFAVAGPQEGIEHLEQLMFESEYLAGPVDFPCFGRENTTTAAQWLRLAYHDMSTHNVDDGSGGLDASIIYELDRPQNVGVGMRESVEELIPFMHPDVSIADVFAFAAVRAIDNCGNGPQIPLRGGRIDATAAGPETVPEPHQDFESHLESFRRQGFTQSEMIALIACGHSVGGVRRDDFPDIVKDENVDVQLFDGTTPFDHAVITGYLDGTTPNPLVVGSNSTTNSDLRIFSSDGNATMQGTCGELFERMINTVPANVVLTDVVKPMPFKITRNQLSPSANSNGTFRFNVQLRVIGEENPNRKVTLYWNDREGASVCPTSGCTAAPWAGVYNRALGLARERYGVPGFDSYSFDASVDMKGSISKFWFEVNEGDGSAPRLDNLGKTVPQEKVLYDPSRTERIVGGTQGLQALPVIWNLVVAVRGDASSKVSVLTWEPGNGTHPVPPRNRVHLTPDSRHAPTSGYTFFSANISEGFNFFDIDAEIGGEKIRQTTVAALLS